MNYIVLKVLRNLEMFRKFLKRGICLWEGRDQLECEGEGVQWCKDWCWCCVDPVGQECQQNESYSVRDVSYTCFAPGVLS